MRGIGLRLAAAAVALALLAEGCSASGPGGGGSGASAVPSSSSSPGRREIDRGFSGYPVTGSAATTTPLASSGRTEVYSQTASECPYERPVGCSIAPESTAHRADGTEGQTVSPPNATENLMYPCGATVPTSFDRTLLNASVNVSNKMHNNIYTFTVKNNTTRTISGVVDNASFVLVDPHSRRVVGSTAVDAPGTGYSDLVPGHSLEVRYTPLVYSCSGPNVPIPAGQYLAYGRLAIENGKVFATVLTKANVTGRLATF